MRNKMPKHKYRDTEFEDIMRKVRKLEKKLEDQERRSRSRSRTSYTPPLPAYQEMAQMPPPPPPPLSTPPPLTTQQIAPLIQQTDQPSEQVQPLPIATLAVPPPVPSTTATAIPTTITENVEEPQLSEEFLLALGHEGEEKVETGEAINNELNMRWTKIMTEGLTKEQKEALLEKYKTPQNFPMAVAPILNKEIAATLSEISINRDKRIIARQNMTGKLMSCLGKSLTDVLKGNINSKKLIEEMNDAAKTASEIYFNDIKSRKFFALSNSSKTVQEACKDTKPGKYLFGDNLAEQLKSVQAVKRTATQIKAPQENKQPNATAKPVNWRGPPQTTSQRGRGGLRPTRPTANTLHPRRPVTTRGAPKQIPRRTNQRRY